MTHLAGNCNCGRKIHLSKRAGNGTPWTCRKCSSTFYLASKINKPLYEQRSKAPPRPKQLVAYSQQGQTEEEGYLLGAILGVVIMFGLLYWGFGSWGIVFGILGAGYWGFKKFTS